MMYLLILVFDRASLT